MLVKNSSSNHREIPFAGTAANPATPGQSESGFTLLEVLIAVVILSIGLLGLAGLQATSLRNNQDALNRSHEALLAYDMIDRMRANMPAVNTGDYHLPTATQDADCTNPATGCTPAEMADHDYFEWLATITAELPAGEGVVCRTSTPTAGTGIAVHGCDNSGNYVIKLWWDDDRDPATGKQLFVTGFQP